MIEIDPVPKNVNALEDEIQQKFSTELTLQCRNSQIYPSVLLFYSENTKVLCLGIISDYPTTDETPLIVIVQNLSNKRVALLFFVFKCCFEHEIALLSSRNRELGN
jgi:hypothetical protein